jgi:aerobic carbon-monoxide dehydrogenase medium subunit
VIPAEFEYQAPDSIGAVFELLRQGGEEAKLLAGGHSLIPLMKLRLATPAMVVDLRNVPGLDRLERNDGAYRIGAMTRHVTLQETPELGLASRAAGAIADQQVRNRGTIGGSLAHGDPASDLPAVLLASQGEVTARSTDGERTIAAADLFQYFLTTALASDEVLTEVRLPRLDEYGYGFQKFARRAEDWAIVGVCALISASEGICEDVRIGLTHMGSTPLRATHAERALRGQPLDAKHIRQAADQAAEDTDPPSDLNASPEYKRHLARVLCRRALEEAAGVI